MVAGVGEARRRSVMVFASEVPVVSALNPYRKIEDVFLDVWRRAAPVQVERLRRRLDVPLPSPEDKMRAVVQGLGAAPAVDELVRQAADAQTTERVAQASARIAAALPAAAPEAVKAEVVQFVTSEMHKAFGTRHEASAIRQYQEQQRVAVKERNLVFSKRRVARVNGVDVLVGGKIDGKAGGKVIEVKNRLRRFISPLPRYDVAQLQTYLFILGATEGELVEHLRSDEAATKLTPVPWDERMWRTELAPNLLRFGNALTLLMEDEDAQTDYLRAEAAGRRDIIRYFWGKDVVLDDAPDAA